MFEVVLTNPKQDDVRVDVFGYSYVSGETRRDTNKLGFSVAYWLSVTALYLRVSWFESRQLLLVFGPLFPLIKRFYTHPRYELLV